MLSVMLMMLSGIWLSWLVSFSSVSEFCGSEVVKNVLMNWLIW